MNGWVRAPRRTAPLAAPRCHDFRSGTFDRKFSVDPNLHAQKVVGRPLAMQCVTFRTLDCETAARKVNEPV